MRRTVFLSISILMASCQASHKPAPYEILVLEGSPYERGLRHGRLLSSKIRSIYTQMFTASILPYLNRLQPDIAEFLFEYKKPLYLDGNFSYQVLLQSARKLAESIPAPYLEEMQGIADGSGFDFDKVLLLNTFVDSMQDLRSIALYLDRVQAPDLLSVEVQPGAESDSLDNNGNGAVDEPGDNRLDPYEPSPYAGLVEIPSGSRFQFRLRDPQGVDPSTVRIQLGTAVYESDNPALSYVTAGTDLDVFFAPPTPLPEASMVPIILQAGDRSRSEEPPPAHARFMRDERLVFTTRGFGKLPHEVENRGERDGRTQPTSIAFGLRGTATADSRVLAAQHFALLDNNAMHRHAVLFIHKPDVGRPFAVLGWSGGIGAFSGMNAAGLVFMVNPSDTLNNPVTRQFQELLFAANLLARGVPMFVTAREVLSRFGSAQQAALHLEETEHAYGWNILLADAGGDLVAVELDSAIGGDVDPRGVRYSPDQTEPANLDPWGRRWASVGPDDLRIATHYRRNTEDIRLELLGLQVKPQRYWSSFYFRSLRAYYVLGERIAASYGTLDVPALEALLREKDLIDQRDSMNAAIYEPESLRMHFAVGQVPATAGPFTSIPLGPLFTP
ncbi:MAG: hypothetical protein HYT87_04200 [Nitrospirae bacterium]|nr:hypothetical protein [Nitrospirota bacterium]